MVSNWKFHHFLCHWIFATRMDFLKHLLIEAKLFILLSMGLKYFYIIERSKKVTKDMVLSQASIQLINMLVECAH